MGRPERLVLATANRDKAGEIAMMLPGIELLPRPEAVGEVDETEDTLEGNARLKARAVAAVAGEPAVADDTGLEVDALDGRPGVFAARYAGEGATYADNVAKLLAELAGLAAGASSASGRRARFRTVALVAWPDGREMAAHGVVEGHIALEPRGAGGFGYDPVFVPDDGDGRTFAEMAPEEKAAVSHRARAFAALHRLLATASGSTAVAAAGTSERPGVLGCGDRVDTLAGRGPLAVTGSFPSKVDGAGDGTFSGTVTVTSIAERVSGVASAEADVFVTRTGKVVVTPLAKDSIAVPVDLAPGTSQAFGARGGIRQCPGGDAGGGQPLAAGRYDIYAVVVVLDDSGRGTGVVATGGPWPLEVS